MKLHELDRGNYFMVVGDDPRVPPDAPEVKKEEVYWFGHIDGMYSFCKNKEGEPVHILAWQEVEQVCNPHPDAPHGFNRNASHDAHRMVCDCEGWAEISIKD